jgi:hypothetical protein
MRSFAYFTIPLLACFFSCAPQTETRTHMDNTSDRVSDSIQRFVDSSLSAPGNELAGTGSPIASTAASFTSGEVPK